MRRTNKPEVIKRITDIILEVSDESKFTVSDLAEAIYEGAFVEFEKDLLFCFSVSEKAYQEKVV